MVCSDFRTGLISICSNFRTYPLSESALNAQHNKLIPVVSRPMTTSTRPRNCASATADVFRDGNFKSKELHLISTLPTGSSMSPTST